MMEMSTSSRSDYCGETRCHQQQSMLSIVTLVVVLFIYIRVPQCLVFLLADTLKRTVVLCSLFFVETLIRIHVDYHQIGKAFRKSCQVSTYFSLLTLAETLS